MLDQIYIILVIGLVFLSIIKIRRYNNILSYSLITSNTPGIKERLTPKELKDSLNITQTEQEHSRQLTILLLLSLLSISIFYTYSFTDNITQTNYPYLLYITTILSTTSLTISFKKNTYPQWLQSWLTLLQSAKDEAILEYIHTELQKYKQQLQDIQNGTITLPPEEEHLIKLKAIQLSQQVFILTDQLDEAKKLDKYLQ
ncbi:MAG: hypothetical protein ACXW2E_01480 [Nitrososphaeraceae archaeon]